MSSTLSGGSCGSSMRPPFLFTTRKCVTLGPPCLIFWMRASARLSSFGIDGYQYVTPPRNVPTSQKRPPSPSARRKRVAMLALSLMQFSSSILPVPFAHSHVSFICFTDRYFPVWYSAMRPHERKKHPTFCITVRHSGLFCFILIDCLRKFVELRVHCGQLLGYRAQYRADFRQLVLMAVSVRVQFVKLLVIFRILIRQVFDLLRIPTDLDRKRHKRYEHGEHERGYCNAFSDCHFFSPSDMRPCYAYLFSYVFSFWSLLVYSKNNKNQQTFLISFFRCFFT